MLDPKITELTDRMIRIQFDERSRQLRDDIAKTQNDAAARGGGGRSSAVIELVYNQCARDMELRAQIVWQNLYRVLSHGGVVLTETLPDELKQEVSKYTDEIYLEPFNRFQDVVRNVGITTAQSPTDARDRAIAKVNNEIDLFVLGLQHRNDAKENQSAAVFNFYSPVGAVQTGPNASAQTFQNVTPQDRDTILDAIQLLKQGLANVGALPAHPKDEIVELVEDTEIEIKKSKPNNSKLLSAFMIIAQAIQTVGSLKPAYDTLKTALLPFGIVLP